jgi:hypothetical protein
MAFAPAPAAGVACLAPVPRAELEVVPPLSRTAR